MKKSVKLNDHKKYLKIAKEISKSSYAIRKKVGAIIVKNNMIISDGYNGMPSGFENECENVCECEHSCTNLFDKNCETCTERILKTKKEVLHAESNAIMKIVKNGGLGLNDSIMYITLSPCIECAKLIIQSGIKEVYYIEKYRDESGIKLLEKANIIVKQIKI